MIGDVRKIIRTATIELLKTKDYKDAGTDEWCGIKNKI